MKRLREIIGKQVTLGFGADLNRLVINYGDNGWTIYGGEYGLDISAREEITATISPLNVKCEEVLLGKNIVGFRLGRNRFLSVSYMGKGDLHVVYLPDEQDLENKNSEFLERTDYKGDVVRWY